MNIIQRPSSNRNQRAGHIPDMIVDHITGGNNVSSALNEFTVNHRASAHFVVGPDGSVYQCVPITLMAWANGTNTSKSSSNYYGKSTLALVRQRGGNANTYTISIEHVNAGGGKLTKAQLAASIELHRYIISQVKSIYGVTIPIDRIHIVGHSQINPITKPCCPGRRFPFDKILAALKGGTAIKSDTTCDVYIRRGSYYTARFSTDNGVPISITAGTEGVVTIVKINKVRDTLAAIVPIGKVGDATGIYTQVCGEQPVKQFNVKIV